jgi:hypothetical protein
MTRTARSRCTSRSLLLLIACGTTACVSARPWRACPPPCQGPQLVKASQLALKKADGDTLFLRHAHWEDRDHPSLLGDGRSAGGQHLGQVRVARREICALLTRRVEPGRVAANVALVPLAIVGQLLVAIVDDALSTSPTQNDFGWSSEAPEAIPFPGRCDAWQSTLSTAPEPAPLRAGDR